MNGLGGHPEVRVEFPSELEIALGKAVAEGENGGKWEARRKVIEKMDAGHRSGLSEIVSRMEREIPGAGSQTLRAVVTLAEALAGPQAGDNRAALETVIDAFRGRTTSSGTGPLGSK